MVGLLHLWTIGARDRICESSCSQLFIKAPMERFFLNKIFKRVAYENIKLKDGINMEVQVNLGFVNFY
jgi:hypothetical protein